MKALFATMMACALCAAPAWSAPEVSLRPLARGADPVVEVVAPLRPRARPGIAQAQAVNPRPKARPLSLEEAVLEELKAARLAYRDGAAAAPTSDDLAVHTIGVTEASLAVRSLRPQLRPPAIVQKAMARRQAAKKGNLGGISGVQGASAGNVPGPGACGIKNALRVTHVSGVKLSTSALMDAATAKALKRWVDRGLKPAVGSMGGGVSSIRVVAHYACRTRNNQKGAKLSEHAKGRAIDIAGFTLRNGETISVLNHWGGGAKGRALRKMHKSACGPFGTVLGPNANRFHRDHFHFDTARYRSGSYCR